MTVNDRNVVLTRIPRDGILLSCYLIGKVSSTVASYEPLRRSLKLCPQL